MDIVWLHSILSWSAAILAALAAIASVGVMYTGDVINQKKNVEIRELKPRSLLQSQKENLIARIKNNPGKVGFISRLMDGEGLDYANQLAAAFREAGWDVVSVAGNHLADLPRTVTAAADPKMALQLGVVLSALEATGLKVGGEIKQGQLPGGFASDTVYVVVGRK